MRDRYKDVPLFFLCFSALFLLAYIVASVTFFEAVSTDVVYFAILVTVVVVLGPPVKAIYRHRKKKMELEYFVAYTRQGFAGSAILLITYAALTIFALTIFKYGGSDAKELTLLFVAMSIYFLIHTVSYLYWVVKFRKVKTNISIWKL
ncbi:MAG: hypothetical protein LBM18_01355 [Oscillospiraceae bacterium]|jgi:hypothetical protein|nr:hypothetical protein [Oscillospiraceae bacterium]